MLTTSWDPDVAIIGRGWAGWAGSGLALTLCLPALCLPVSLFCSFAWSHSLSLTHTHTLSLSFFVMTCSPGVPMQCI